MNLFPVFVEDMEDAFVLMLVQDQHANPRAQQHRLDHVLWYAFLFAVKYGVMNLVDNDGILAFSFLTGSRRFPEPASVGRPSRFDLRDQLLDRCARRSRKALHRQVVTELVQHVRDGSAIDIVEAVVIGRVPLKFAALLRLTTTSSHDSRKICSTANELIPCS